MPTYDYHHLVTFEDTNLVGNVYYVNHVSWQGQCRERFLRDHAPAIIDALRADLVLATTKCSCEYFRELDAFDEVIVRMSLVTLAQNRITMGFDYDLVVGDTTERVARGEQEIVTMRRTPGGLEAVPVPEALRAALALYAV